MPRRPFLPARRRSAPVRPQCSISHCLDALLGEARRRRAAGRARGRTPRGRGLLEDQRAGIGTIVSAMSPEHLLGVGGVPVVDELAGTGVQSTRRGGFAVMLTRAQWFWGRTWNAWSAPRPGMLRGGGRTVGRRRSRSGEFARPVIRARVFDGGLLRYRGVRDLRQRRRAVQGQPGWPVAADGAGARAARDHRGGQRIGLRALGRAVLGDRQRKRSGKRGADAPTLFSFDEQLGVRTVDVARRHRAAAASAAAHAVR